MTPATSGFILIAGLCLLLITGMPIAFALGLAAVLGLFLSMGLDSIYVLAETMFAGIGNLAYVAIPMFVLMGALVAGTPAGSELYRSLDRWLYKVPGGLVLSNIGACAIFSGMTGSSPATCAAIGKLGIPEMTQRGYPSSVAAGSIAAGGTLGILIPPSVTMIVYGIATQTSIGRLFLAGVLPGLMLTVMFMTWAIIDAKRKGFRFQPVQMSHGWRARLEALPRILPLLLIIAGMMYVLYGGVATPSEAAGAGAMLTLLVVLIAYRSIRLRNYGPVFASAMRESVMIMMIMAAAELFAFALSSLYITQSLAEVIATLEINRWALMGLINVFLLFAGMFLPPVAVIVMSAPLLFPIVVNAGFDPYWFAVVLTINMEIGLITPPVGLNLFVINSIAPDIPTKEILWGSLPYVLVMMLAIVILCVFPGIVTFLPDLVMGPAL
ncbi:TRAP transporter large permease [Alcaligenes endophyticus]|uniref:TRAP transporter large permease protein n=1 Tax=Alcaligenes endophyticus TaxID=1929088 RepID=A0ABT8EHD8_9BURK|nr:TRAP transporter large permease [Alcaligenes endophyticus]MCX5589654.1 TRAP transporter large permease [Alcaligenes endophyticus]MDN4120682.1 TRAP transporter large permease [Alcaligenes endophyticus]